MASHGFCVKLLSVGPGSFSVFLSNTGYNSGLEYVKFEKIENNIWNRRIVCIVWALVYGSYTRVLAQNLDGKPSLEEKNNFYGAMFSYQIAISIVASCIFRLVVSLLPTEQGTESWHTSPVSFFATGVAFNWFLYRVFIVIG